MIRNHFDDECVDRFCKLIEPRVEIIKHNSKPSALFQDMFFSEWEKFVSIDYLPDENLDTNLIGKFNTFAGAPVDKLMDTLAVDIKKMYPNSDIIKSGSLYYPKGGFMGWHTNSNQPCTRIYVTYASESNKSFFRYCENGEEVTDYDDKGITVREFTIPEDGYFWHCVGSDCDRISFGFRVCQLDNCHKGG
tara:strand:+ start:179 stop:751 length:573 start_codon:yes stop_codon:yes gene_type:complete